MSQAQKDYFRAQISVKKYEILRINWLWDRFLELHNANNFSPKTYREIDERVKTRITKIEKSIKNYEYKLIKGI